jgi:hypothetical protein
MGNMTNTGIYRLGRHARATDFRPGTVLTDAAGHRAVVTAVDPNPHGNHWYDVLHMRDLDLLAGYASRAPREWTLGGHSLLGDSEPYDPDEGPMVPLWVVVPGDRGAAASTPEWYRDHVAPAAGGDTPALRHAWLGE